MSFASSVAIVVATRHRRTVVVGGCTDRDRSFGSSQGHRRVHLETHWSMSAFFTNPSTNASGALVPLVLFHIGALPWSHRSSSRPDRDDLRIGGRRQLHVERRTETAIAHLHYAGLGIRRRGTGLGAIFGLLALRDLRQLLQRGANPLRSFLGRTLTGRLLAGFTGPGLASNSFRSSATWFSASANASSRVGWRRNEAAPALARTFIPSWATRSKVTNPSAIKLAALSVSRRSTGRRAACESPPGVVVHRHTAAKQR